VFVCELAGNARKILRGEAIKPNYSGIKTVAEIGALARTRWLIPRAVRRPEYKDWELEQFRALIFSSRQRTGQLASQSMVFNSRDGDRASA